MFALNSEDSYLEQFYIIAEIILNHGKLKIGETFIQITEIEIYYKTPSMHKSPHQDPYVHCDKDQLTQGCFYFHRQNGGKYKGGTFKGLDITIGDGKQSFGGILIRSIFIPETKDHIEGPCRVVDKILALCGYKNIDELVRNYHILPPAINVEGSPLRFVMNESRKNVIYFGPRVGLTLSGVSDRNDPKIQFLMKPYRFTTYPSEISKSKHTLFLNAWKHGTPLGLINGSFEFLCQTFGTKRKIAEKWIEYWEKGEETTIESVLNFGIDTVEKQCKACNLML